MSRRRLVVTLYGRPGCHLCGEVQALLEQLQVRLDFDFTVANIEEDDTLHTRYIFEIPVVVVDGEEVAKAPIAGRVLVEELELRVMANG